MADLSDSWMNDDEDLKEIDSHEKMLKVAKEKLKEINDMVKTLREIQNYDKLRIMANEEFRDKSKRSS